MNTFKTITKFYLPVAHPELDNVIHRLLTKNNVTPPCKKGCANCCRLVVFVDTLEAMEIVLDLLEVGTETPESLTVKMQKASDLWRLNGEDRIKMYRKGVPCPFLDTTTESCTIYDKRPISCRAYIINEGQDPAGCAPPGNPELEILNLDSPQNSSFAHHALVAREMRVPYAVGYISDMILAVLDVLVNGNHQTLLKLQSEMSNLGKKDSV
jgi:Fe-S-cluster containining protein